MICYYIIISRFFIRLAGCRVSFWETKCTHRHCLWVHFVFANEMSPQTRSECSIGFSGPNVEPTQPNRYPWTDIILNESNANVPKFQNANMFFGHNSRHIQRIWTKLHQHDKEAKAHLLAGSGRPG